MEGHPRGDKRRALGSEVGARWQDLPDRFPPYQTCHRCFQQWSRDGTLRHVLEALVEDLRERCEVDLGECFIDGTSVTAKKGACSR